MCVVLLACFKEKDRERTKSWTGREVGKIWGNSRGAKEQSLYMKGFFLKYL